MIDTDDLVPSYYVNEFMRAVESSPDVVSFIGYMTTNGANRREFTIKLGEKYEERQGQYFRYPNHLCFFKRSVVEHIKFPDVWVQEDYMWATEIMRRKLLKTEVHIAKDMYHYDFRTKPHNKYQRVR